jgi:vancomycin resistance protein VanW
MLQTLRRLLPFSLRVELIRLKRYPLWLLETPTIARTFSRGEGFDHLMAEHCSPLNRWSGRVDRLQRGKEQNVAQAARRIDRLVIQPHEVFSYHRAVGRPSRLRGFVPGLELREGRPGEGVGGGCCQVSNLLYLLCLRAGMRVVERHRHGFDLFADHHRTVPFGCGATVFYNYADLRFENPLPQPALLRLTIQEGELLVGQIWLRHDPGWSVEVYEEGDRFFRQAGQWWRENRVRRRFVRHDGSVLLDREEAHNVARVLYAISVDDEDRRSEAA